MVSIEDMKSIIQEWMAQELSPVDLGKTYAEVLCELNKQFEYCMNSLVESMIDNRKDS